MTLQNCFSPKFLLLCKKKGVRYSIGTNEKFSSSMCHTVSFLFLMLQVIGLMCDVGIVVYKQREYSIISGQVILQSIFAISAVKKFCSKTKLPRIGTDHILHKTIVSARCSRGYGDHARVVGDCYIYLPTSLTTIEYRSIKLIQSSEI